MKLILYYIACIMLCATICSCQSDDQLPPEGMKEIQSDVLELHDGIKISGINLYCLSDREHLYGELWWEKYARSKVVENYSEIIMILKVEQNTLSLNIFDDEQDNLELRRRRQDFYKDKCDFIIQDYNKHFTMDCNYGLPVFFAAYINGEVRITCDKSLFGLDPGTDLKKYFMCTNYQGCLPKGVLDSKLLKGFGDQPINNLDQILTDEAWLSPEYFFRFIEYPNEKYDKLTIHIDVPIKSEHVNEYLATELKGHNMESRFVDTVYRSDCNIFFE